MDRQTAIIDEGERERLKRRRKLRQVGIPLSAGMMLVTLGVVYGDIGTSPMYTLKAIIEGNGGLSTMGEETVLGALSLISCPGMNDGRLYSASEIEALLREDAAQRA